jgi:hypothetical protein
MRAEFQSRGERPYVPPQSSILIDRHFGLSMSNMISSTLAPMETHRTISRYRSPNLYKSTSGISSLTSEKTSGRLHVHSSYARDLQGVMQLDLPCIHLLFPSYRSQDDLLHAGSAHHSDAKHTYSPIEAFQAQQGIRAGRRYHRGFRAARD